MGYVIHIDGDTGGGGGSGTGWDGQVEFRADLPITIGSPAIGSIYLVEKKTTLLGFTTYQSGLYIRDTNLGALSDWRRLNVKVNFTDSEFAIVSSADNSKKAKFDLSLVTTSTTRTYIYPDKNGTIALLSDVNGGTLAQTLTLGDETGDNNIVLDPGAGPHASPQSRGAIVLKDPGSTYSVAAFYLENDVNTGIDVFGGGINDGVIAVKGTLQASIRHKGTNNGFTAINTGCSIAGFLTMQATTGFQLQNGANEIIFTANPTSNGLTQTFQDASGVIALLSDITGGGASLRNVTATDTFATAQETINCTANTFTVNLPTAVGIQGTTYTLVNSGTGIITLDANGTETINGSLTIEIKRNQLSRTVQSDGTNWIII
tara:strand:+ start:151 stop:1275 length:1125 start_codon:yes stop_codon:yes gene_type:complete